MIFLFNLILKLAFYLIHFSYIYYYNYNMTIFIEYVVIDNFIISYLVLYVSSILTKINIKKSRLLIGCSIYVLFALLLPLLNLNIINGFILKGLLSILLCLIVLDNVKLKSKFFIYYFTFLSLSLLMFAICNIMVKLFGGDVTMLNYNLDFPIAIILFCIFIYFKILIGFFSRLKKSYEIDDYIFETLIEYNSKKIKLNAFLDTGNSLYDNKYNLPVAVTSFKVAEKLLTKNEVLCLLMRKGCTTVKDLHYINYSTASSKNSSMPVFKLDNFEIVRNGTKQKVDCMLGISFARISNGINYDMLLGLKMIE